MVLVFDYDLSGTNYHQEEIYGRKFILIFLGGFLLTDIILKFNTGIYKNQKIINDKKIIAKTYIKSTFIYDLIGLISSIFPSIPFPNNFPPVYDKHKASLKNNKYLRQSIPNLIKKYLNL